MSYRCSFCGRTAPKNTPQIRRTYYKKDSQGHAQIIREVPICGSCDSAEREGVGHAELSQASRRAKVNDVCSGAIHCDLCGDDATDGQVTAEGILCPNHLGKGGVRKKI
jgi:hypothetical protein